MAQDQVSKWQGLRLQCRSLLTAPMCPLSCLQNFAILLCYLPHHVTAPDQNVMCLVNLQNKILAKEGEGEPVKMEYNQEARGKCTTSKRRSLISHEDVRERFAETLTLSHEALR